MKEEVLLTSPLEYTNEPYAIAKIAGLKMCESFNLQYGTNYSLPAFSGAKAPERVFCSQSLFTGGYTYGF